MCTPRTLHKERDNMIGSKYLFLFMSNGQQLQMKTIDDNLPRGTVTILWLMNIGPLKVL